MNSWLLSLRTGVLSFALVLTALGGCGGEFSQTGLAPATSRMVTGVVTPETEVVVHVTGVVLASDYLPSEVPLADVTVMAQNLRGEPLDLDSLRTQTDVEGRFELWIPMKRANYPYWWGDLEVDGTHLNLASPQILCCSGDATAKDCLDERSCQPGDEAFYKIGLSRRPATSTPAPTSD